VGVGLRALRSNCVPSWNKIPAIFRCYRFPSGLGRRFRINRRWDSGILTAGFQIQPGMEGNPRGVLSFHHSIMCPRRARAVLAQRRMSGNRDARTVTTSAKSGATRASSNRIGITSTFSNRAARTTSDRNAHFFLLDSSREVDLRATQFLLQDLENRLPNLCRRADNFSKAINSK